MDSAEIIAKSGDYWVVLAEGGRRLYIPEQHIVSSRKPFIGEKGLVGYVQGPASMVLTFVDGDFKGSMPAR